MTTVVTPDTTLVDLVIEWRDAKLAIRAHWDETQGKKFDVRQNMVARRANAERALMDYARGLDGTTPAV